jgi:hypothetical protein
LNFDGLADGECHYLVVQRDKVDLHVEYIITGFKFFIFVLRHTFKNLTWS